MCVCVCVCLPVCPAVFLVSKAQVAKRNFTYTMLIPGFQGVSMPGFMPIGLKLWTLEVNQNFKIYISKGGEGIIGQSVISDRPIS